LGSLSSLQSSITFTFSILLRSQLVLFWVAVSLLYVNAACFMLYFPLFIFI
jgi:hypothetical protein